MENDKRRIGDNSKEAEDKFTSLFEKEAVSEMMIDIKSFAKETEEYICKMSATIRQVLSGTAQLTEKQEQWNHNVDNYNDWVMDLDPNPKTNKKRLRVAYKPKKLSVNEIRGLQQGMQDDLDLMVDTATNISATVNAYQDDKEFKIWVDATRMKRGNIDEEKF